MTENDDAPFRMVVFSIIVEKCPKCKRRGLDKPAEIDYNRGAMTGRSNLPGRSREQAVGASLSVPRRVKVAPEPRKKDARAWL